METSMRHNLHNTLQSFKHGKLYSLPMLGKALNPKLERLPVSIRIVLESVLRNCDGKKVTEEHVRQLAAWQPNAKRTEEIPFVLARIVLQDFTGGPLQACSTMRASTNGNSPVGFPFGCPAGVRRSNG